MSEMTPTHVRVGFISGRKVILKINHKKYEVSFNKIYATFEMLSSIAKTDEEKENINVLMLLVIYKDASIGNPYRHTQIFNRFFDRDRVLRNIGDNLTNRIPGLREKVAVFVKRNPEFLRIAECLGTDLHVGESSHYDFRCQNLLESGKDEVWGKFCSDLFSVAKMHDQRIAIAKAALGPFQSYETSISSLYATLSPDFRIFIQKNILLNATRN